MVNLGFTLHKKRCPESRISWFHFSLSTNLKFCAMLHHFVSCLFHFFDVFGKKKNELESEIKGPVFGTPATPINSIIYCFHFSFHRSHIILKSHVTFVHLVP
jgi:hypothetical protein